MVPLLLALLVVALAITIAGYLLSLKPQARNSPEMYSVPPGRRRIVEPSPSPMRARRLTMEVEQPAGLNLAISGMWERVGDRLTAPGGRQTGESPPWTAIIIGLVSIFILGLYSLNLLLPHHALFDTLLFNNAIAQTSSQSQAPVYHATQNLVRIGQLDPGQYNSTQEYNLWAYSACSAAAMTEVINSYGHHYRVTDILQVEAQLNEITPALGLLEDVGIARTVARFGFKTTWGYKLSLDQVISIANQGRPVIVSFPPDRYDGGHIVVVTGGNSDTVYLADTSLWNRHSLTRTHFLQWWEGFSAIVTPN